MATVLVDNQLDRLLAADPPLATKVPRGDFRGPSSRIQAASLDLTVGDIFIPGADAEKPGGSRCPRTKVSLREGRIAVIRTLESLAMPSDMVALGFPPNSLSIQGVLMTNPGQIDPGYQGPMHLTVINMSREPLTLSRGQRIIRLIFVRLDAVPSAPYQRRHPNAEAGSGPITDELLQALSIDFLNVEERASDAVKNAQLKAGIWSAVIAAVVGIVVASLTTFVPRLFDRYYTLESGLNTLTAKVDVATLKDRVDRLEAAAAKPAAATPGTAPVLQPAPGSTPTQAPR
jgi:dCTP deaminase